MRNKNENVREFHSGDNHFIRCSTAQAGFVRCFSFPKPPTAFSARYERTVGVFAENLLLDSLRHITPLAPATDVVLFRRGIAVREVRRAHEAILSDMLQEIIKILVSFAVHERPPRTEELLRIAVVAPVNRIVDGPPLPLSEKYAGRLNPSPNLLHRVGNPCGAGLQKTQSELGKTSQQARAHGVHEAPHHGNNGRTKERMGIRKELGDLRRAPTEMNAKGEVKSSGFLIDRKELRISQIPLPHHAHGKNTRSAQIAC